MPVRVCACQFGAFGVGEIVNTLVGDEVNANIVIRAIRFGELICVAAIGIDMADR